MYRFQANNLNDDIKALSKDIYKLCEAMKVNPTWQQRQLLDAVMAGHSRIAVKAGMGPGKSYILPVIAIYRNLQAVKALTIVTAPTMRQCTDIFMKEARQHIERADSAIRKFIRPSRTRVVFGGDPDWAIVAFTARKVEAMQGSHNPNMTILCEEASGIPREIMDRLKGTASNPNCLTVKIGNPTDRDSDFFDCFHSLRDKWHCMTWNAEETPDSQWFTKQRNIDIAQEFGIDSDMYRFTVLGEFPKTNPDSIIPEELLLKAMDRKMLIPALKVIRPGTKAIAKQFGIDIARKGGDESTIYRRQGMAIAQWQYFNHTEPQDVVETAFQWQKEARWRDEDTWYMPDSSGMGQGVLFNFVRQKKKYHEFHFGGRSSNRKMYANAGTEAYFHLLHLLKTQSVYIPYDARLVKQLTTRKYYPTTQNSVVMERKEDYLKRHESPDRADGLVLAFYDQPAIPGAISSSTKGQKIGMEIST